jgi:hypothetical protein
MFLLFIAYVACNVAVTTDFSESESKTYVKFAKMISCAAKPLEKSCPSCLSKDSGFNLFFFYQTSRLHRYKYKFMIHYNDSEKKVLISMAGPSVKEYPKYVQLIYTQGFSWVRTVRVQVESEYKRVYYSQLRNILVKKIQKVKKSGRANYQFVFTGHSIGGSMATLAALDLTHSKVLSKNANKTKVFTFGGLRVGDQRFVKLVNSSVFVYRIIRNDDYIVRIPNCYYSLTILGWRCFSQDIINKYVAVPTSPLFFYLQNYRYSYYYTVPVIQTIRTVIAYRRAHPNFARTANRAQNTQNRHHQRPTQRHERQERQVHPLPPHRKNQFTKHNKKSPQDQQKKSLICKDLRLGNPLRLAINNINMKENSATHSQDLKILLLILLLKLQLQILNLQSLAYLSSTSLLKLPNHITIQMFTILNHSDSSFTTQLASELINYAHM